MDSWLADSYAYCISRNGNVVGGKYSRVDGTWDAFMWTEAAGVSDIGSLRPSSAVFGANADGTVLVGTDQHPSSTLTRAAVWVGGVETLLDGESTQGQANAMNADGTIVVGMSNYLPTMWKWQDGTWVRTRLKPPDPRSRVSGGFPRAVSDDG